MYTTLAPKILEPTTNMGANPPQKKTNRQIVIRARVSFFWLIYYSRKNIDVCEA